MKSHGLLEPLKLLALNREGSVRPATTYREKAKALSERFFLNPIVDLLDIPRNPPPLVDWSGGLTIDRKVDIEEVVTIIQQA